MKELENSGLPDRPASFETALRASSEAVNVLAASLYLV
jgi:hypothetical protein